MATIIGSGLDAYLLREARERALNVVMEAREIARRIIEDAEEQAAAHRAETLDHTRTQLEAKRRRALAQARLEARRAVAAAQQTLLDRLWETAAQRLETFAADDPSERLQALAVLTEDAARQLGGGRLLLSVSSQDLPLLTPEALREIEQRLQSLGAEGITVAGPESISGGVIVRRAGTRQVVDNSFDARLNLAKRTLRDEAARLLVPPHKDPTHGGTHVSQQT